MILLQWSLDAIVALLRHGLVHSLSFSTALGCIKLSLLPPSTKACNNTPFICNLIVVLLRDGIGFDVE